jgi:lipopolysaccharide biosynthesis glycosyltransferase
MREDDITDKLLARLKKIGSPKFVDQDILNIVCQHKVKFIPQNWDYTWHLQFLDKDYLHHIGGKLALEYQEAQTNPYIVHFTGHHMKPIDYPGQKYARIFLEYIKQTPYEQYFEKCVQTTVRNLLKQVKKEKTKLLKYKTLSKITCGKLQKQFLRRQTKHQQKINEIEERILR